MDILSVTYVYSKSTSCGVPVHCRGGGLDGLQSSLPIWGFWFSISKSIFCAPFPTLGFPWVYKLLSLDFVMLSPWKTYTSHSSWSPMLTTIIFSESHFRSAASTAPHFQSTDRTSASMCPCVGEQNKLLCHWIFSFRQQSQRSLKLFIKEFFILCH